MSVPDLVNSISQDPQHHSKLQGQSPDLSHDLYSQSLIINQAHLFTNSTLINSDIQTFIAKN